jgi:hypothetical protein
MWNSNLVLIIISLNAASSNFAIYYLFKLHTYLHRYFISLLVSNYHGKWRPNLLFLTRFFGEKNMIDWLAISTTIHRRIRRILIETMQVCCTVFITSKSLGALKIHTHTKERTKKSNILDTRHNDNITYLAIRSIS